MKPGQPLDRATWYLQFPKADEARLDRLRGDQTRADFLRGLLNDALEEAGEPPIAHYSRSRRPAYWRPE